MSRNRRRFMRRNRARCVCGGHGCRSDSVIHAYNNGATPEDIVQSFTTLKLRDVYAVITYYRITGKL